MPITSPCPGQNGASIGSALQIINCCGQPVRKVANF